LDTPPPAAIDDDLLTATLAQAWSIDPRALEYVPKGVGSYHWRAVSAGAETYFVTVDDLDTKPWIGQERDSTFDGLCAAYATAWTLNHDDGLALVVPPINADDGSPAVRLGDQYSVSVFPFVDGEPWSWGQPVAREQRALVVRELAQLHKTEHGRHTGIRRRARGLPERDALTHALDSLDHPWTGGAYSERARFELTESAARVLERLARFDDLAALLDRTAPATVVTHGEPHPGNLIQTPSGLRMIDWDTVALAEPERDLWMLGHKPDGSDEYSEATGHAIDPDAIEFYRLGWTLSDIASFTAMFRSDHPRTKWAETKWEGFVALLRGAESEPYGPSR
jgi:spectinomycin phosphotransferase